LTLDTLTIILLAVCGSSFLGLILVIVWFARNKSVSQKEGRISRFVTPSSEEQSQTVSHVNLRNLQKQRIGKFREWINDSLSNISSDKLQLKLSSAYWEITDTEYILIRINATVIGFILAWVVFNNVLAGIFLAVIALLVPPILLDRSIAQRQKKFHNQLLDVLILIKGAVQAGYSLMQALDLAVNEIPAPASEEFGRVLHENRLGITMETALINLSERMENDDLHIVVTAIIINSQVGGNLSTVLESAISTIRDRMHLFGEVKALTSYSRYVGTFLTLMPFITGMAIFVFSPGYFDTVKTSILTQGIFAVALVGVIIGNIWVRKIVDIKV
jgi:tight adherence protein B